MFARQHDVELARHVNHVVAIGQHGLEPRHDVGRNAVWGRRLAAAVFGHDDAAVAGQLHVLNDALGQVVGTVEAPQAVVVVLEKDVIAGGRAVAVHAVADLALPPRRAEVDAGRQHVVAELGVSRRRGLAPGARARIRHGCVVEVRRL